MSKRFFGAFLAVFAICVSAQNEEAVFNAVMKQVDTGGIYLNYTNNAEMAKTVNESLDGLFKLLAGADGMPQEQAALIRMVTRIVLDLINLDAYKAQALSCKADPSIRNAPVYVYKGYMYTGEKPAGLGFELVPRMNLPFASLPQVPANARFAVGIHLRPKAAWDFVAGEFAKNPQQQLQGIPAMLAGKFEEANQIKLNDLLESMSGELSLLVTSEEVAQTTVFRLMLTVPDAKGTLAQLINRQLAGQLVKNDAGAYVLAGNVQLPPWVSPQLFLEEGRVVLISHPDILLETKKASEQGGLSKSAAAARFFKDIPTTGTSYAYLDIEPKMILNSLEALGKPELSAVTSILKIPLIFGVTYLSEEGYHQQFRSNMSISSAGAVAPMAIYAGILLPSLNKAQARGRNIGCMSNLKQLGLALYAYAADHQDQFPAAGDEGLRVLQQKRYIPPQMFKCAGDHREFSYFYLGKLTGKLPSQTPLAFEKPGTAHGGSVNVLFQDGHVESLAIGNYQSPVDVVNFLQQKNNYPPELLDRLLQLCRSLE